MEVKSNKILFIFLGLLIFSSSLQAQTKNKEEKPIEDKRFVELIIGVPKVSEKNLFVLTETVPKIKGIKYVDFCEKDKLLLLKYDPEIFPKREDIIKAFQAQNIVMPMLIKEGIFKDVEEMCPNLLTK